jgi:2-polyprenyl-3-methyl-5-hydroxy-6-metoxy-1,4-benzoquinol methylase
MSGKPPAAYDRVVGRYSPSPATGPIALAQVEPETRVLDVCCGQGWLAPALAVRFGAEPFELTARAWVVAGVLP